MITTTLPARRFLGKTSGFTSKEEKHFHQRMLKAYLNGRSNFDFGYFGFERVGVERQRRNHKVLQEMPFRDRHPSNRR